jgi:competence protein ComEC
VIARAAGALPAFASQRLALVAAYPRHVLLAGLVVGLLLAPVGVATVLAVASAPALLLAGHGRRGGAARVSMPRDGSASVAISRNAGRGLLALAAAAAVILGAGVAHVRLAALDAGRLASLTGQRISARATLLEPIRERVSGPAVARVKLLDGSGAGEQAVLRVRGYAYRGAWPEVGDELRIVGRVAPLGRFDAYQRRRNAHAAIEAYEVERTGHRRGGVAGALDAIRRRAERGLEAGLAPKDAALLRGMVLGEDERLTDATRTDFQHSGLAHILAVSGQNVMLLAALVLLGGALTGIGLRARLLLAIALIAVYVPLAGGGPSIQRAGVMGIAGLVAALAGRPAQRWYALGLAAAATLALNPRAAGEPGWQLSFAAVAALLMAGEPLRTALARRLPGPVADAAAITVAATVATAPLMALYFDQVSLASLPANLVAAPAVAPVMWLGMLAAAAAQVAPAAAAPFTALSAPLLVFIAGVAHASAAAPLAALPIHAPPAAILAGWAAVAAAVALIIRRWRTAAAGEASLAGWRVRYLGGRRRAAALVAAGVVAIAVAAGVREARAGGRPALLRHGEVVVSFLDIGQGDATLVQLDGASLLVDTGPPDGPIVRRLAQAHVKRLDALLLTHAQADHEGAAQAVIRAYAPRLVIDGGAGWSTAVQRVLPAAVAASHGRAIAPVAGETVAIGAMRLRILWPPAVAADWKPEGDPNERAVVARLEAGGLSVLLTADAESDVTAPLGPAPVDVLKVAHHGSADPGLPALLARLHPRVAAIEVGRHNIYGHPAASTVAALRAAVPTVIRTDRDGTVRLHALAGRLWMERT